MRKIALALALCSMSVLATQASATTVDISVTDGGVSQASGSFSYATGATGVLGYGDLTSFSLTVAGVTYSLADVLPLTDYVQFAYDTSSNILETNPNATGFDGSGFNEILGAINSSGTFGFFFNPPVGAYAEYSTGAGGSLDALTLTPVAVPEPATWAMMLAGLGMTGVLARRRKTVRVTYA